LPDEWHFTLSLPVPEGFLGRECNAPECGRQFKVHKDDIQPEMHCPYCGVSFPNDKLWTAEQLEYASGVIIHELLPQVQDEVRSMFRKTFTGPNWKFTPGAPTQRPPMPEPPVEKPVDSQLRCPECSVRFQVNGIFGYCPGCRSEILRLYDANLEIIRREVREVDAPDRVLRHAYADLVSTFEIFCRKEAINRSVPPARFQNLEAASKAFGAAIGIDMFAALTVGEDLALRRAFQKRHVSEHNGGTIDERYVDAVPEDRQLLGQQAVLTLEELELAAHAMRRALEALVAAR
jgi:DNA-directed RNA polymerase subunit RPC12/RpoP